MDFSGATKPASTSSTSVSKYTNKFKNWVSCRPDEENCYTGVVWTEDEQYWMIVSGIIYLVFDFLILVGPIVVGAAFFGPVSAALHSAGGMGPWLGGVLNFVVWVSGGWNFLLYGMPFILGSLMFLWPENTKMAMLYQDWTYWGIHVIGLILNILLLGFNAMMAFFGSTISEVWPLFLVNLAIFIAGYVMYFVCWEAMVAFYNSGYFTEWLNYEEI